MICKIDFCKNKPQRLVFKDTIVLEENTKM